jgi:hypothetical protein
MLLSNNNLEQKEKKKFMNPYKRKSTMGKKINIRRNHTWKIWPKHNSTWKKFHKGKNNNHAIILAMENFLLMGKNHKLPLEEKRGMVQESMLL